MLDLRLAALRGAIYDAAIEPDQWPLALDMLASLLGGHTATLLLREKSDGATRILRSRSTGSDDAAMRAYQEHYGRMCPVMPVIARARPGTVLANYMAIPKRQLIRTEFYQDWVLPSNAQESACASLIGSQDGSRSAFLALIRGNGSDEFTADDLELVTGLLPDLARALKIQQRLMEAEYGHAQPSAFGAEALDRLSDAILFTNRHARVVWSNAAAEKLLRSSDQTGDGLVRDRHGQLRCGTSSDTGALTKLIARTALDGRGGDMCIQRPPPHAPLFALTFSLAERFAAARARWPLALDWEPLVALVILDADLILDAQQQGIVASRLRAAYGLTEVEAAVVVGIANGDVVKSLAVRRSVAESTIRAHLKSAFVKLDVHQQSQIVRIVRGLSSFLA